MEKRVLNSIILVLSICIACFLMSINANIGFNSTIIPNEIEDTVNLKISATFDGTEIDDLPGSLNNWSWAKSQGICTGSGTQLDPYLIDGHIFHPTVLWDCLRIFNSRKYFTITNCEFRYAPDIYSGIYIVNTTNGRIINNDFHHNKYGIFAVYMNDTLVSGNDFYLNYGDGLNLYECHRNSIINNNITLNGWQGMWMEFSSNNIISENMAHTNNFSGIHLFECDYLTINDNMFSFNAFSGLSINSNTYATISDNEIKENGIEGLYMNTILDCSITGNKMHDNVEYGINALSINDTRIESNDIYQNLVDGLLIRDSNRITISSNNLSLNGYQGMWIESCTDNIISKNIGNANNLSGICLYECNYSTINDNTLNYNKFSGLRTFYNLFSTIENNEMNENDREGIYFRTTLNSSIIGNTMENNGFDGIYVRFSNGTVITENIMKGNVLLGIRVGANTRLNKIFLNCFNNSVNAEDNGINNQWDNGIEGNYWADYIGVDTNSNGIGDVPYSITGSAGSQDNFPLMICPLPLIEDVKEIPSFNLYIIISVIIFSIGIIWVIRRKKFQRI